MAIRKIWYNKVDERPREEAIAMVNPGIRQTLTIESLCLWRLYKRDILNVVYSKHFAIRKELRGIPDGMAETIFTQADEHYKDTQTDYFIAVKHMEFQGAERDMALTYSMSEGKIVLVTLHPLKDGQRENRVRSRRWVKIESLL
ncbi:hypothetical protein G7K71_05455 [Desulfofundulus sp. TPOSR]|uniref:hypothetical protein n=1 Tax=Desulfofundulus sp. TPOSR TaxID=2714340 RepID=UPI001409AFD7|nr:hypothetical protein [Desulfofundulus sp. TPOSR]NHM26444.1 hypothetical protein [Desulfofundulus sp. TPOSR]